MPTSINFLLDELYVDESYSVCGNAEPSIINGLLGNVTFEPWTGFRNIIDDAAAIVEQFTPEQLFEANTSLRKARRFISKARKDHVMSLDVEKKRKADHDLKVELKSMKQTHISSVTRRVGDMERHEGPTLVSGPPMSDDPNITTIAGNNDSKDLEESSSSEEEDEEWKVELPVNTSSSILDLHKDISDFLKELLLIMYPEELLLLDLRTISTEGLFREKRRKMLYKYMVKVMNDEKALQENDSPETPVESNTQSEAVQERADAITVSAHERPQRTLELSDKRHRDEDANGTGNAERLSLEPDAGASASTSSTALQRSGRILEKSKAMQGLRNPANSVPVPTKPVIGFSQTPDRALFRIANNDRGAVPVCCYEFKAPALDLSGLKTPRASGTKSRLHACPSRRETTRAQGSRSASVSNESSNGRTVSIEVSNESGNEDDLYMAGLSAGTIAAEYDRLFKNPQHMNKRKAEFASERLVLLPIAQVICQALLSKSGCVFLTNHQMSFALRVEENKEAFGVRVFVTGAIPSNQAPGQIAAMVGFTKYCVDKVMSDTERNVLDPHRRLVTSLSYKAYNAEIDTEQLDPDWCPLDQPQDNGQRGSQSGRGHARNCETDPIDSPLGHESAASSTYEAGPPMPVADEMAVKLSRSDMDERLKAMFATTEGLLGVGACGIAIRGVWDGRKVAIKMWNGQARNGFLSIRREIKNYDRLQSKCPAVLGCAVPGYFLGWDRPQEFSVYRKELILITELVGERIFKNRDGRFWIDTRKDYEMVESFNIPLICDAALCSLEKLHEQGFLHGDIALRNIRVMHTPESEFGWRVWWVDLGGTSEMNYRLHPMFFDLEKRRCFALFELPKPNQGRNARGQLKNRSLDITPAGSVANM